MARIRTIKPEFFDDEDLPKVSMLARLTFIGLWTEADKEGRLEDRPTRLKVRLFPYEPDTDMEAVLEELANAGFIVRYTVPSGKSVIQIRTFRKHQRPHPKEPDSALPGPDSEGAVIVARKTNPVKENGEPGKETAGRETPGSRRDTSTPCRVDLGREGDLGEGERVRVESALSLTSGQARLAARELAGEWNARVVEPLKAVNPEPSINRIIAAMAARPSMEAWREILDAAFASDYLMGRVPGRDGTTFNLTLWWLFEGTNADKVLAGAYRNRAKVVAMAPPDGPRPAPGIAESNAARLRRRQEAGRA